VAVYAPSVRWTCPQQLPDFRSCYAVPGRSGSSRGSRILGRVGAQPLNHHGVPDPHGNNCGSYEATPGMGANPGEPKPRAQKPVSCSSSAQESFVDGSTTRSRRPSTSCATHRPAWAIGTRRPAGTLSDPTMGGSPELRDPDPHPRRLERRSFSWGDRTEPRGRPTALYEGDDPIDRDRQAGWPATGRPRSSPSLRASVRRDDIEHCPHGSAGQRGSSHRRARHPFGPLVRRSKREGLQAWGPPQCLVRARRPRTVYIDVRGARRDSPVRRERRNDRASPSRRDPERQHRPWWRTAANLGPVRWRRPVPPLADVDEENCARADGADTTNRTRSLFPGRVS